MDQRLELIQHQCGELCNLRRPTIAHASERFAYSKAAVDCKWLLERRVDARPIGEQPAAVDGRLAVSEALGGVWNRGPPQVAQLAALLLDAVKPLVHSLGGLVNSTWRQGEKDQRHLVRRLSRVGMGGARESSRLKARGEYTGAPRATCKGANTAPINNRRGAGVAKQGTNSSL